MDIQTSPDPVARARELGAEIVAAADEIERTRRIPEALLERLHDSRLFRMLLPRSAGGDETSLRSTWRRSKNSPGTTPRSRGTHSSPTVPP
jgi:alkylation response protein AidB-like acyl-CoA dehydrogenase